MKAFSHFDFQNGKIGDLDRQFPSYLSAWTSSIILPDGDTHFLYVDKGPTTIVWRGFEFTLHDGMYGSFPDKTYVAGGQGIAMTREGWRGFMHIGGPAEHEGRLKYIDGCTDSLLIPPVKLGDPCLNLLYFPAGIDQTAHTHPSDRIGMIMSGKGRCHAWENEYETIIDLVPGMIFCIHTDGIHKFSTPYGEHMRVLAYHPDSDFGPTDQEHPMINRTIVNGVPASKLPGIQTK